MTRVTDVPRPEAPRPASPATRRRATAEAVLEAMPLPTLALSERQRVVFANTAAELLLAPLGGLLGRNLEQAFAPGAAIIDLVKRAWTNGAITATDLSLENPAGRSFARVDVHAAPFEDGQRLVISFVPRSRTHAEVAPETVSALARTLAHEVRNPLAGIRAAAQLIAKTAGDAQHHELLDLIVAETDRIHRLTERIDALEGLPPPRLGPVNVHEALDRVRGVVSTSFPELRLRERYDPSLPSLHADFDQLIQAFLNIAKNAAEAATAHRGAEAALSFSTGYRSGVRMRAGPAGRPRRLVEVAFEDNGPGLPPGLQGRAFEPFFTTKRGGMGLGLAVSAEIVARHDGRIEVDSTQGRTVFRILLPFAEVLS